MRKFYLLTLLAFLPLLANADAVEIDGIYYNLNAETHKAEVTSNPNKYSGEVTVPASITYNATVYSVTAIGEWAFMDCWDLHKVNIPSTVSVIGSCAFWDCSSLEEITLPEGLTAIECSTFEGCSSLKKVIIPSTVTRIGNNPGEPSDGPFSGCPLETLFVPASVQTIGGGGLWASPNTIIIMESVTPPSSIDIYALEDALGGQIFSKIIVPDGSKSAYQNANVWNKYSDDILEMSESSVRIFKGVEAGTLSTLISESEKYDIEYLEITGNLNGDDLALIRDMAGNNINGHLTDGKLATLDLSGASIVDGGTYVQFTEEKYYIDADNYVIVKDTKPYTSQANVFRGFLFAGCGALETITLPNTLLSISNSSTFSDCKKLTTIYIPASVGYMDSGFTNCPSLTSVVIDPNNVKYESPNNNVIIDKESHALITGCKDAVIPTDKGINSISKYAFLGRIGETTMEIPEGITSIGDYAFAQTGITSVVLPSTLVTIDNRAFQGCNQLTEIVIPASVKTIGDNTFSQCSSLKTVTSQIVDPSTVTVGNNAFAYYSIDLIVPVGSVSAYKAAEPWKKFREILDINEMQKSIRSINVEKAGTLSTFISDEDKFAILELTLTGELNGTDFRLLREMAGCGYDGRETNGKLRTLDLSGIRIVADAEDSEGYLNATQVINDNGGYSIAKSEDLPLRTKDNVLGDCIFAGCNKIRSIKFPAGIKEMGHDLFTLVNSRLDIVIPKEVTYIHPDAFNNHPYPMGSFKVEEGNQVYSSPNNCNAIVKGTTLEVGCKNTVIPEGITTIGSGAFNYSRGCPALPESVTRIESRAFYYANASTVTLPKNLQFIGSGAFASFAEPDLKTVYSEIVDPSVVTLEEKPFGSTPIEVLYVPEGTVAAYEAIPSWKNSFSAILEKGTALEQLTLHVETAGTLPTLIPEEKKNHIVQLTLTGNLNGTDFRLIREMAGNDYLGQPTRGLLKKLDISGANIVEGGEKYLDTDRVTSSTGTFTQMGGDFFHFGTQNNVLGNSLFAGCGKLEEIVLPNSITSIGEYVFWYCLNLKALEIPKNVSSIGLNFVYGQNKLSKLTVAEGNMTYSSPANSNALMQGSKLVFGIQNTQIPEGTTVIGANAFASHGPWQVTLPEGVTTIESYAFSQTILGILNMPSTLTTIGPGAFEGCWQQLRSFTLPKSVTSIDGSAFLHCSNLTEMKVEEGNPVYDSRENCNAIIETGSYTLIAGCKNTIIPNSVTTIGQYAFGGIGLTTITIPSSVTSIDHMAFCENTELSDVYCNAESVPNTGTDAFSSVQIEQVTLHVPAGSVEAYQAAAPWSGFNKVVALSTNIPDVEIQGVYYNLNEETLTAEVTMNPNKYSGEVSIASGIWYDSRLYSVTSIGVDAFQFCNLLTSVVIPNSVTSIGSYAFYFCEDLSSIMIPNSVTKIFGNPFQGCSSLESILVEEGNTTYDSRNNCNAIIETGSNTLISGCKNTVIPANVTTIGDNAFTEIANLTSITIPASVEYIGSASFSSCSNLESIQVESGNTKYDSRNNCNAIIESSSNTLIHGCKNTVIPANVTSIGEMAFDECDGLTSVTIPSAVTFIGISAFEECKDLVSMQVESGNTVYDSRNNCNAIIETASNTLISGCKNTIIPISVTSIGENAFRYCFGLTFLTIPCNVTSIGNMAFFNCYQLTDIYCSAENVPTTGYGAFDAINGDNVTLYVPAGSVEAYKTESPWKDFGTIRSMVTSLFDGTNLWTSYVAQKDYAIPAGLEAYVISSLSETSAVASQIDYIPQGVPILLKRNDAATNSFDFTIGTGTAPTTNLLKVYDTDKTVSNREGYILFKDEFVLVNEGTLPAGRVFLPLNGGNSANTRGIVIEGEGTTGIQNLVSDSEVSHGVWYDLQGRKIDGKPIKKGVYILNGRKVVVK